MRVRSEAVAAVGAVAYVLLATVAMNRLSYDVWGAFVLGPVLLAISYPLLRRVFVGDRADLLPLALLGLLAKFAGAGVRYWISYNAYLGYTDSASYHRIGVAIAAQARAGEIGPLEFIPHGLGTRFIEQLTGFVYTFAGSSRVGGSLVFATLSFWGSVFYLLAGITAVPGLRRRWYAVLLFFAPSLVYWPSSVGKEAWMSFALGLGTYGTALLLTRASGRSRAFAIACLGFIGAAFVRPHVAAMWVAGAGVALAVALATGRRVRRRRFRLPSLPSRSGDRSDMAALWFGLVLAALGLVVVASVTLRYLDPMSGDDASGGLTDRVSRIFDETQRRSSEGGSTISLVTIEDPTDWPAGVISTLTRPYPWEINDMASLLPGAEMVILVGLGLWSWRRIVTVPRQCLDAPFLLMVVCATFMFGLAFSSIANLGILTRQRSLVLPFGALLICVPYRPRRRRRTAPTPVAVSASPVP